MSLANRIRILVLALCASFGFAVLGAFHLLAARQLDAAVKNDVRTVSSMLETLIRGRGELLQSLTRFVATSPRTRDLTLTDSATVTDVVTSLRKDVGVDALSITDQDGRVLGEAGFQHGTESLKGDISVQAALSGKSWSGIIERDGDLLLAASEPLKLGDLVHGAVVTYLRLGADRAKELTYGGSLDVAFVSNGRVTASSHPMPGLKLHAPGTSWSVTLGKQEDVAQMSSLPGSQPSQAMGFVVFRPTEEILGPFRQFSLAFAVVLGLVALVAVVGGSAFGTSLVRSLDGLVLAAGALQCGEWPAKLTVRRHDEIGLLQTVFNNMSDSLQASQNRLLAMIDLDPLTELYNHRRFLERLGYEAARTSADDESMSVLLLDLDKFKDYNEQSGHAAGDSMLKTVAQLLKEEAPELAEIGRYRGAQFAVILPNAHVPAAHDLFERVQARMHTLTLSAGCAELTSAKGKTDGLMLACELALTRAKQLGRNRACDFDAVAGPDEDPSRVYRYLQDGSYATIKALAAAVDAKDPYTHGHSDRVATYASDLAAYMGADADEVDLIRLAGTLHDVGKIGVPDSILKKPARLDDEEIKIMEAHPVLGEVIVAKVPQLSALLPGVRHHHERFDGKGYPDGLAGDAIPREARFLAVADTYDAMTSDRPYRKGLAIEIALTEIAKGAGTQFDPEMAAAFVELMRPDSLEEAA